eukprot:UN31103
MNGSSKFITGKTELLKWLNTFLNTSLTKIEQCANGAVYCQLLDALYPDTVSLKKVNFTVDVSNNYEVMKNWRIVQNVFGKKKLKENTVGRTDPRTISR